MADGRRRAPGAAYLALLRLRRLAFRVTSTMRHVLGLERTVYVEQRLGEYRGFWTEAAQALGAELEEMSEETWEVRLGDRRTRIAGFRVPFDDLVTAQIAGDKLLTLALARGVGVRVTEHRRFTLEGLHEARAFLEGSPMPCVVKPMKRGGGAQGVTTYVSTPAELTRAALRASIVSRELLVERVVPGETVRLLFLDGRLLHAVRRRGVWVTGDGSSTVSELVQRLDPKPRLDDPIVTATLSGLRRPPGSVPGRGEPVLVRSLPMGQHGGVEGPTTYDDDVTAEVGVGLVNELRRVVDAVGSRYAGVDIVTSDCSVGLEDSGGAFLELNTSPGLHQHHLGGEQRPLAVEVLRSLLTG